MPAALEAIKQGRLGIKNESQGQGFATHKGSHTHTHCLILALRAHSGPIVSSAAKCPRRSALAFFLPRCSNGNVCVFPSQFEVLRSTRVGRKK